MVSEFNVTYEDHEAFDGGHAFPVRAHLANVCFVFFAYGDWAVSSAAFVLGVSWASLSWTNWAFSPLFSTLMVIVNVCCSLSIAHKIRLWCSARLNICAKKRRKLTLVGLNFSPTAFSDQKLGKGAIDLLRSGYDLTGSSLVTHILYEQGLNLQKQNNHLSNIMKNKIIIAECSVLAVIICILFIFFFPYSPKGGTVWNSVIEPQITYKAVLDVDGYASSSYWTRNSATDLPDCVNTIVCSVTNTGNSPASNVNLEVKVDGAVLETRSFPSIAVGAVVTHSLTITIQYDSTRNLFVYASCSESEDSYSFSVTSTLPRYLDQDISSLYVTPNEPTLVALKNQILKDKFILTPNWMALRDWVADNVKYTTESTVHGGEYWQLPKETIQRRTGDCEDFSLLLCSLLRADGWSTDSVYVVVGEKDGGYHAWVKIIWSGIEYGIEPQANGWSTLIGDWLILSGYDAEYMFNDGRFNPVQ